MIQSKGILKIKECNVCGFVFASCMFNDFFHHNVVHNAAADAWQEGLLHGVVNELIAGEVGGECVEK